MNTPSKPGWCSVDGCERLRYCRGWCRMHYKRWLRRGDPGSSTPQRTFHGLADTPIHQAWLGMIERTKVGGAHQRKHPSYAGVTHDQRWATFTGFLANPPVVPDGRIFVPGLVLARVDDVGPYSPENARWRSKSENGREATERTMYRLSDGRLAGDVARQLGILPSTWGRRFHRLGWDIERAVTEPVRGHHRKHNDRSNGNG